MNAWTWGYFIACGVWFCWGAALLGEGPMMMAQGGCLAAFMAARLAEPYLKYLQGACMIITDRQSAKAVDSILEALDQSEESDE